MALESTAWTECVNVFRNEAWGVSMSLDSKAWSVSVSLETRPGVCQCL